MCTKMEGKILWRNERPKVDRKKESVFKSMQIPVVLAKVPLRINKGKHSKKNNTQTTDIQTYTHTHT